MNAEERAYELLKWQSLLPVAEFQEGFPYAKIQKERSDKALDQWDKDHPVTSSPELTAFRELERMGIYTQNDYYSPSKAADGFYSDHLRQVTKRSDKRDHQGRKQRAKSSQRPLDNSRRTYKRP